MDCARQSALRDRVRRFVDTVFDGRADDLILHLIEDTSISEEDLLRIQKKLKAARGRS